MVKNDWRQDGDKWFYLGSGGAMVRNAWSIRRIMSGQTVSGSGSRLNFGKEQKNMKNPIRVTEAEYENRKQGKKPPVVPF